MLESDKFLIKDQSFIRNVQTRAAGELNNLQFMVAGHRNVRTLAL